MATPVVDGQSVIVRIADASGYADQVLTLVIEAKIDSKVTDEELIATYGEKTVPNKATVVIDNKPGFTNEVKVTPPDEPDTPPIKKQVETSKTEKNDKHGDLAALEETYNYEITTKIPTNAKGFKVTDALDAVLEPRGEVTVMLDGKPVTGLDEYDPETNTLTVTFTEDQVKNNAGKDVVITFSARIAVSFDELLEAYPDKKVPNKASYTITDLNGEEKTPVDSNEVTVTPPNPDREDPKKTVSKTELGARDEVFTYTVSQLVPAGSKEIAFTDTLVDELQFEPIKGEDGVDNAAILDCDGTRLTDSRVNIAYDANDDQTIVATVKAADGETLADLSGKTVTLTFNARIKAGITDGTLVAKYGDERKIPNQANVTIDNEGRPTNIVEVVPPEEPTEDPVKKINGDTKPVTLANRADEFVYTVSQKVPATATEIAFSDVLDECLEVIEVTVDANGADIKVGDDNRTVEAVIKDAKALRNKTVTLKIRAKVAVDDAAVVKHHGDTRNIPNEATVTIDEKGKTTNKVEVIPPVDKEKPTGNVVVRHVDVDGNPLDPTTAGDFNNVVVNAEEGTPYTTSEKDIPGYTFVTINTPEDGYNFEGDDAAEGKVVGGETLKVTYIYEKIAEPVKTVSKVNLDARDEVFTYTVTQRIPKGAVTVNFTDELENVLEVKGAQINVPGIEPVVAINKVSATIADKALLEGLAGKDVTLTITAKIKDGISDETLIKLYGSTEVPNEADVTVNNNPQTTNKVVVIPPPVVPEPEDPVKKINGDVAPVTLAARDEVFTYTVEQLVPEGIERLILSDTLENVLEIEAFASDPTRFASLTFEDGTVIPNDMIEINLSDDAQTIFASLIAEEGKTLDEFAGKKLVLTFNAKIKADVTDDYLVEKYGYAKLIPNQASARFSIDDTPRWTNKVLVTPPPETPEIPEVPVKKVSDADETLVDSATLASKTEDFTYTISQVIPKGAVNVTFTDTLESVLDVTGAQINVADINVDITGNRVTAVIADARELAGQTVELTISAKLKADVTDDMLIALYGTRSVPNTANVNIDGKGQVTNEVLVTPPDAPVGSVRVRHVYYDADGVLHELETWSDVQKDQPEGTDYTTEQKPFDGYSFVKLDEGSAPADGKVVADTTLDVVYVYAPLPEISKKVNGKEHENLERNFEIFTYTVETTIPQNATGFVITDTIESVLRFRSTADTVKVTVNGQPVTGAASISGQTLTVAIPDGVTAANPGAAVVIEFRAQINPTEPPANLEKYIRDGQIMIPNTADYVFKDAKGEDRTKNSNEVTVTPPTDEPVMPNVPPIPDLKKYVNDKEHEDLKTANEVFRYRLVSVVAKDSVGMKFEDTLVDELQFAGTNGNVKVTIGGVDVTSSVKSLTVTAQTLTVELSQEQLDNYMGEVIEITFDAQIREGKDLSKYIDEASGKILVPNKGTLIVNNDVAEPIESNVVTVTPPVGDRLTTGMKFSKQTVGGSEELEGAVLAIYSLNEDGTINYEDELDKWTSGKAPHIFDVPYGEYALVEISAPDGYEIAAPIIFRTSKDGSQIFVNGEWVDAKGMIVMIDNKKPDDSNPDGGKDTPDKDNPVNPPTIINPPSYPGRTVTTTGTPSTTRRVVTPSTSTATRATSTGDANSTTLWIVLAAIAAAAAAGAAVMVRRRRREDD